MTLNHHDVDVISGCFGDRNNQPVGTSPLRKPRICSRQTPVPVLPEWCGCTQTQTVAAIT